MEKRYVTAIDRGNAQERKIMWNVRAGRALSQLFSIYILHFLTKKFLEETLYEMGKKLMVWIWSPKLRGKFYGMEVNMLLAKDWSHF